MDMTTTVFLLFLLMMTGSRCALRRSSPKFRLASFAVSVCITRLLTQSLKEYSL
ncbi:Uncharacterised protein [Vibrio cholerae]|nr:Uncharacterised protein [Vibrio cholerae]